MEIIRLIQRLLLLPVLLAVVALTASRPGEARGYMSPLATSFRLNDPPSSLDSDSELLRALEFLEKYENAKGRDASAAAPFPAPYAGIDGADDFVPYPMHVGNEISPALELDDAVPYNPLKWDNGEDEEDDDDELAMEDLFPPRPDDLETNALAVAEAILDEYRDYESRRQRELFDKILGDVMAEKLLEQDEEDNIARLLEEQGKEQEGLEDLAAIFGPSSSASSSVAEVEVYDPQELELSMFSASSEANDQSLEENSHGSDEEDVLSPDEDHFFLSEAGLEALDEAERILKEGYMESDEHQQTGSSESMPDFDDTSTLISLLEDAGDSESSEAGESIEEEKQEALKDVIYRIVQDTLRRKLLESMLGEDDTEAEFMESSSIADADNSVKETTDEDEIYDNLLDNLVDEIRDQVDKLSSKIIKQIEGEESEEDMTSQSERQTGGDDITSSSDSSNDNDGFFNEQPITDESSSIPDEVIDEIIGEGLMSSSVEDEFDVSSSLAEVNDDGMTDDEAVINAINEIVPAAETRVCPVLSYLVDDCSVIEGFSGLGAEGYREAFSRPCNRHQICYTCSTSYEIPTQLCDEIYKAELLTLCNGDQECKQRAKYFWIAATNDRTPPNMSLSLCSDRCVLDYLLSD